MLCSFLSIPIIADAYSKSFSFDFAYSLKGSTDFNLSNKDTDVSLNADTYYASGSVSPNKAKYSVTLNKFLKSYSVSATANGNSTTKNFGKVASGTYNVDLNKTTQTTYGERIIGSGKIKQ